MTVKKIRAQFLKLLSSQYTQDEIGVYFEMLCEAYLNFTPAQVVLNLDEALSPEKEAQFIAALKELQKNEPIQYIIGAVVFADLVLEVDERVLIPRPETEELVYWLLSAYDNEAPLNVLDIGTGSGCVAIALKKARPNWKVTAWDVDLDALATAKHNAKKNSVTINFEVVDILGAQLPNTNWDIIVSNPPYVPESEKAHTAAHVLREPEHAIFVSESSPLIFYEHIINYAAKQLNTKGSIYLEGHAPLMKTLYLLLTQARFSDIVLQNDFRTNPRFIRAHCR
ncbi:MAG: peptide chain release factor N(5)-glutamine methyltransferase [Flavobacteriaceae bacterium]|nr:protein-(glutamine-N5) methyltransferase, release factor-specific [Flavobacteriaceae bacterium]